MTDVTRAQSNAYIETLKEQGYVERGGDANDVSAGTVLQKDEVTLSIAHAGTILNLLITVSGTA